MLTKSTMIDIMSLPDKQSEQNKQRIIKKLIDIINKYQ